MAVSKSKGHTENEDGSFLVEFGVNFVRGNRDGRCAGRARGAARPGNRKLGRQYPGFWATPQPECHHLKLHVAPSPLLLSYACLCVFLVLVLCSSDGSPDCDTICAHLCSSPALAIISISCSHFTQPQPSTQTLTSTHEASQPPSQRMRGFA